MRPPQDITTRVSVRTITCPDISKRSRFPPLLSGLFTTTDTRVEDSWIQSHEDGTSANQSSLHTRIPPGSSRQGHTDVHTNVEHVSPHHTHSSSHSIFREESLRRRIQGALTSSCATTRKYNRCLVPSCRFQMCLPVHTLFRTRVHNCVDCTPPHRASLPTTCDSTRTATHLHVRVYPRTRDAASPERS